MENVESRDGASILGSLSLRVVRVGRNGDDSVRDLFSKVGLGNILHLPEKHGRYVLGPKIETIVLVAICTWLAQASCCCSIIIGGSSGSMRTSEVPDTIFFSYINLSGRISKVTDVIEVVHIVVWMIK
jgi:hypothetical protein